MSLAPLPHPEDLETLATVTRATTRLRYDDIGNATRFWHAHASIVRYVARWDAWLIWDHHAGVWREDHQRVHVLELAKSIVDDLWGQVASCDDPEQRKKLLAFANLSGKDHRLRAALVLARGLPDITVEPDQLDANPWLLNVANGTINLRTGALRSHDARDLITKRASVNYDPDATAPTWHAFLAHVLPDPDVRAFLQRAIGYSLTGVVTDHVLFLLLGAGQNGKSTFVTALRHVLGDYAIGARKDLFVTAKHGQHDSSRVALQGGRFVAAAEVERGSHLAEAEVKELTGGERITARRLYGEVYEFEPTWKLWLSSNYRPHVHGTDEGIWRRIRLIEWPVSIPKPDQDPELGTKLEAESPGILRWALDGLEQWLDIGLAEPAAVIVSTASYRAAEDLVGRFLDDSDLTVDPGHPDLSIATPVLTTMREKWCAETGEQLSARALSLELQDRGCMQARANKERRWRGIGRLADAPTALFRQNGSGNGVTDVTQGPKGDAMTHGDAVSERSRYAHAYGEVVETNVTARHASPTPDDPPRDLFDDTDPGNHDHTEWEDDGGPF